jgi:hypothetical protein
MELPMASMTSKEMEESMDKDLVSEDILKYAKKRMNCRKEPSCKWNKKKTTCLRRRSGRRRRIQEIRVMEETRARVMALRARTRNVRSVRCQMSAGGIRTVVSVFPCLTKRLHCRLDSCGGRSVGV